MSRLLKECYLSDEAGGGSGDVTFEDVVLDDFVVGEGVHVVVEGGGDFYHDGVVARVQMGGYIVVYPLAIPFHAAAPAVDYQLADVVYLAEVEDWVGAEAVVRQMGGVGDGACKVLELGLAEVAESLHDGVACPALYGMVERDVPAGVDGEIMLPFAVGG